MSLNKTGARTVMTREVICVQPQDTLEDAYSLMTEWQIRHLPVVEGGILLGVLSDRDVLARAQVNGAVVAVPAMAVSVAMTPQPLVTCRPTSSVGYVAGLMLDYKIDCVPVTDVEGLLVGLVTSSDLLQLLRDRDDEEHKILPFSYTVRTDLRPQAANA